MANVVLKDICKQFDSFQAINNLDLDINDGEFLILVGPSGCGKSTALRMIAGLEEITSGSMTIDGVDVVDMTPKERDIAMVFQSYALYPHMTVGENIGFSMKLAGHKKADREARVSEIAKTLQLTPLLDQRPANLSGGQRQRVAMGRAMVRKPSVFLMDEPLSNLDAKLRVQMRAEIARLQRQLGVTTIYVTHDQIEAMTMGDRVAVMKGGILQQVDTPKKLYKSPANVFVAGFIGSPSMNLFEGKLHNGTLQLQGCTLSLDSDVLDQCPGLALYENKTVIFGIRPEDIYDHTLESGQKFPAISAQVGNIEELGSELVVHLTLDATSVDSGDPDVVEEIGGASNGVAKFEPRSEVKFGTQVNVGIDVSQLHFFDRETHLAIKSS